MKSIIPKQTAPETEGWFLDFQDKILNARLVYKLLGIIRVRIEVASKKHIHDIETGQRIITVLKKPYKVP